jgi:hypothetical protein
MILSRYKPHLALLAMFAATTVALTYGVDVKVTDDVGVVLKLPDQVGAWTGHDIFFCQNEKCLGSFEADQLTDSTTCPRCGSPLKRTWSLPEVNLLPPDTVVLKKEYVNMPGDASVMASIVVNGSEQVGIHRPQICLVGQGFDITSESDLRVDIPGRQSLTLRVLEIVRRDRRGDGQIVEIPGFYAYWFVGMGRETQSHTTRMFYTTLDRVIHGRAYRWAYVAVFGMSSSGSEVNRKQIAGFVKDLYPLIKAAQ